MSSNTASESRATIHQTLKDILEEMFETDPARVVPEALLYDDLDIDSIDAVDLIVRLKEVTGRKVSPEEFKAVRTVGDVITAIEKLLQE
jgi:acyl carrier protein